MVSSTESETSIRALGEVVLRVRDLPAMTAFYEKVLGLTALRRFERSVFFRIAPSFAGHTQMLALFDQSIPPNHPEVRHDGLDALQSPLHHFAFAIGLEDYYRERVRLEGLGLTVRLDEHHWVKCRSLYIRDPEGNVIELVCYDQEVVS